MRLRKTRLASMVAALLLVPFSLPGETGRKPRATEEAYAGYVWPPAPDPARIRLTAIVSGRADVEAGSRFSRMLIGASPQSLYDNLRKPFGVKFDRQGRLLVTDTALGALFRFDRERRRMDVFGTKGSNALESPLGLALALDGTIFVADAAKRRIVAFDEDGGFKTAYGKEGELANPTGVAVSPDQTKLFVADSREHRITVFDAATGELLRTFGSKGAGDGELYFPTSVAFSREGELCVVDQMNARIVVFTEEGELVDAFGEAGARYGQFVRPKDIAIDDAGLIYVTDAAFGNVQIFANDLRLLTFVGRIGADPGEFGNAAGVATHGDDFAVVDQVNRRVQLFRFIAPKGNR